MTRRQKEPLRPLRDEELSVLTNISRAQSEPAIHVARAKALLVVASGESYTAATRAAGRHFNDAVSQSCPVSAVRGWQLLSLGTEVAQQRSAGRLNVSAFLAELESQLDREREELPPSR